MMSLHSTEQFHEGLIIFPGMLMISLWYTERLIPDDDLERLVIAIQEESQRLWSGGS